MLKHEPQPDTAQNHRPALNAEAAQARVTPEELAAAVARLESRRAGGDGKIAIGEAVRELSLDATPEEILAEVRAGQASPKKRRISLRQRVGIYLAAGAVALSLTAVVGTATAPAPPPNQEAPVLAAPASAPPARIRVAPDLLVGDASGKLVLLSEVGDGQAVRCTYSGGGFQQYALGASTMWTLIKHGGEVYVRGWIPKMSPRVLADRGADVGYRGDANYAVPITLPVRGFSVSSPSGDDATFHAVNVHLDQHAYEKWNP